MKILVVDDDAGVREMLRGHFASRAHEVLSAGTALEGLRVALQEKPDSVILDLGLPDFSGEEVLRTLKKQIPGTRVMILTGREEPGLEKRVRQLGCDSFLEKGTSLQILEEILQGWSR